MRSRWLTTISFTLIWVTAAREQSLAASPKTKTAPSQKSKLQTKVKKPKPAPKSKPAAKNKKAAKTPAIPTKPAADIPEVKEAALVWRGCLESQDLPMFASGLGVEESRLSPLLAEQGVLATGGACVPFVAATGGEDGAASVVLQRSEQDPGEVTNLDIRKTSDGITVTPGACECPAAIRRVMYFPVEDVRQRLGEILASVPSNVRWQLDTLLPQMIRRPFAKQGPTQPSPLSHPTSPSHPDADVSVESGEITNSERLPESGASAKILRIVLARQGEDEPEHLHSLEIVDAATGKQVDGAWWLQRDGGPGVFIGMEGIAYERLLWQSPVKYLYKSRGVGPAVTTFKVRVPVPKGESAKAENGKAKTKFRTVTVREYHLGVDLLAPKGAEVHAVADAKVAFAGRNGGYGNLIILDHGLGYQTYYAHLSVIKPGIKVGAQVPRGDVIGLVRSTGRSTAPHLHFETRKDGKYIDPFDETRQLKFWVLSPDDQERLGMELLSFAASLTPSEVAPDYSRGSETVRAEPLSGATIEE